MNTCAKPISYCFKSLNFPESCDLPCLSSLSTISSFCPPALITSPGMIQRKEVVLSVLGELQDATESSGLDALTRVALEVDQVLAPFQLPRTPCLDFPEWAGVDDSAHRLYPLDAPMGLLPLNCKGEGNLLFDAVSMLLVGNVGLSLELQVRSDGL